MLTVQGKTLGSRRQLFEAFSVPAPMAGKLTLRALLGHVVRQEVASFQERQADRRLLHVLTAKQIEQGLAQGKVDSGGRALDQKVDVEQSIATVIEAFQDGLFLVVLDETEMRELDAPVTLADASRLTFIRLSLIAGG